jgi:DNA-binding CsgD family transcriptional regulator
MLDTMPEATPISSQVLPTTQAPKLQIPMHVLWRSLVSGQLRIQRTQHGFARCFVFVKAQTPTSFPPALAVHVTERILAGEQPKVVASELAISQATVCQYCRIVLDTFSDSGPVSRASTFAVMCACAARGLPIEDAVVHGANQDGDEVLSVALPDGLLECAGLSEAERSIAWARIQGRTTADICAERKTSPRTIANQLNAIHRKLQVSGRRELLAAALTYAWQQSHAT